MDEIYGFSVKDRMANGVGLGALLYDVCMAKSVAKLANMQFVFIDEDLISTSLGNHSYIDFFNVNRICIRENVKYCWPQLPPNVAKVYPDDNQYEWFAALFKEVFNLTESTQREIDEMRNRSVFRESDVIFHLRRTDKIFKRECSITEAEEITIDEQVGIVSKIVENKYKGSRVFLCTCDASCVQVCKELFKKEGIEMVYDDQDPREMQTLLMQRRLQNNEIKAHFITAIFLLHIMSQCKALIGGRYSYLFRAAELLRGKMSTAHNIKDSDTFLVTHYDPFSAPVNVQMPRRYRNFIGNTTVTLLDNSVYQVTGFINDTIVGELKESMKKFNNSWLSRSTNSTKGCNILNQDDQRNKEFIAQANVDFRKGYFAYSFLRTHGKHFKTCMCFFCKLIDTFNSKEVFDFMSSLVCHPILINGEVFLSVYEENDFLSIHHDKNKGEYAFVLSLTENWNPVDGGLTCFLDETKTNVLHTFIPTFGNLLVFRINPDGSTHHFVSRIVNNKRRISLTGWFNLAK